VETIPALALGGKMKYSYALYVACGGRIDEENYARVMKKVAEELHDCLPNNSAISQTRIAAELSGISLDTVRDKAGIDPRCIYGILRNDDIPKGLRYHHGQMSDQQLLVESLRMLEVTSAVDAVIAAHPNISFNPTDSPSDGFLF
jgi:hypothetical protein